VGTAAAGRALVQGGMNQPGGGHLKKALGDETECDGSDFRSETF
jgi:hypothetical protein